MVHSSLYFSKYFFRTKVAQVVGGKGKSTPEDEFQVGNTMKVVGDGVVKFPLQVGVGGEGAVETVEVAQAHLHQFLRNLLFAG